MTMTLAIFGADGAVGREAVHQALDRGHRVIAIEHADPEVAKGRDGVTHRACDVLDGEVAAALDGADAVLSCLGLGNDLSTLADPPPLYTQGTMNICAAMLDAGLKRLVVISASFVAAKDRGPIWFRFPAMIGLAPIFDQMEEMESHLRETSDIDWTAVRPGWLIEGDLTADYTVQANVIPEDHIRSRHADVAHFMLDLAEGAEWKHQTPAISRAEDATASSPDKVVKAMVA